LIEKKKNTLDTAGVVRETALTSGNSFLALSPAWALSVLDSRASDRFAADLLLQSLAFL
jgi:hypothetical protein